MMVNAAVNEGATVFLLTIPPDTHFTTAQNTVKNTVDGWIDDQGSNDVVIVNISAPLADPNNSNIMLPQYNIGDGEHPNTLGMSVMAETIVRTGQAKGYFNSTKFWTASADGSASDANDWSGNTTPVAGDHIVFDSGSVKNCTLDQAMNYGSISMLPNYTGVVTLGADISTTNDQVFLNGTFTGSPEYNDTCGGHFIQNGTNITTNVLNLVMSGNNKMLQVYSFSFYSLVLGNTTIMFDDAYVLHDLTIRQGATVVLEDYGGIVWMPIATSDKFVNNGEDHRSWAVCCGNERDRHDDVLWEHDLPDHVCLASWSTGPGTLTLSANSSLVKLTVLSLLLNYDCTVYLNGYSIGTTNIVTSNGGKIVGEGS